MALSGDLISQFVQVTKEEKQSKETTVYGTVVEYDGGKYVKLDGSELLTPISTTADALNGERVTVMIKNHTALVTGNISSPSARTDTVKELDGTVKEIGSKISEFEIIIADKVSVERLEAEIARIDTLVSENVTIKGRLDANEADIGTLTADNVTINEKLIAAEANIEKLETKKLDADIADIKFATIESLNATDIKVNNLEATYGEFKDLTTDKFTAIDASIENLETNKLSATEAEIKYANIDFSNINMAAVEELFAKSGIIKDLVVDNGAIAGELVGVTIRGDLIEGNTIVADKLVIKGDDGLYYKLNTDGVTTGTEQTDYNSLNGTVIRAKSVTAEKIAVEDLVAFGATIGGFHITDDAIYSGVKAGALNTTRGVYMDNDGQFSLGDSTNFFRYFKDTDGQYKLELSASSVRFATSGNSVQEEIADLTTRVTNAETQIESNKNEISLRATTEFVETTVSTTVDNCIDKTTFEEYQKKNEAELSLMANQVEISVSETVRQEIKDGDDELRALYEELRMNYDFTADGQYIGKKDSDTMMRLVNDMMQILVAGVAATTVDRNGLTADQANIKILHMGDYTLALGDDDHLTLT